jgi:multidrug resistance efflux pump
MKKILLIVVIIGVIGGGCYLFWRSKTDAFAKALEEEKIVKVVRGPIRLSVNSTGRVVSNLDVEIKCKASGQVIALPYDISDKVTSGALLVKLDPKDEKRRLEQAVVDLDSSKARLAQAKLNLQMAKSNLEIQKNRDAANLMSAEARARDARAKADRVKQLFEKSRVSREEYETADTTAVQAEVELQNARIALEDLKVQEQALETKKQDINLAQSQVQSNTVNLELARQRLTDTTVYAPIDATVSQRGVQIGQIISSPMSNVGGGSALLTLSDLSHVFVYAAVDESDIGKVQVGQRAEITADAFPETNFKGEVVRIATKGVVTSNVVTFEVRIEIVSENKSLLKPEMTANIEIVAAEKESVLLVPVDAVQRRKGKQTVSIPRAMGEPEERLVEAGIDSGVQMEIISGLKEGEQVLVRESAMDSRWSEAGNERRPGGQQGARSGAGAARRPPPMPMGGRGGGRR